MRTKIKVMFMITMLLAGIGGICAYWVSKISLLAGENNTLIEIGEAKEVDSVINVNAVDPTAKLVPIGQKENSVGNTVEYLIIPIEVRWQADSDGVNGASANVSVTLEGLVDENNQALTLSQDVLDLINIYLIDPADSTGDITGLDYLKLLMNTEVVRGINAVKNALQTNFTKYITLNDPTFDISLEINSSHNLYMVIFLEEPTINTFEAIQGLTFNIYTSYKLSDDNNNPNIIS